MSATIELTVELPENVSREEAQLALAVRLFQQGKVSLGQAAAIAGQSKRAFIDTLGREGVTVVNYPAEELREELMSTRSAGEIVTTHELDDWAEAELTKNARFGNR